MKKCIVIGGGVIGLSSAYYLAKAGHDVTVIDQSDMNDGCSYGNAGMIVPSHVVPLAQPGMISQGIKWMFNSKSPFYVKLRLNRELLSWGWQFYKNSTKENVEKAMPALRDLSQFSKELFQDLAKESNLFNYEEKGLLMLFKSDKVGEEETHAAEAAQKLGLEVDFLSKEDLTGLETGISTNAIGGIHYKGDAHLSPQLFMKFLKVELARLNVNMMPNSSIQNFSIDKGTISSVKVNDGKLEADEFILCAGSWSPIIAKQLGIQLSILPGKGYSFNIENEGAKPTIPSILCEGKVAVTPMGENIRFGGTMEITNIKDQSINANRVQGIVNTVNGFYPNLKLETPKRDNVWSGFRPCTPSGLPIIKRSEKINNLIIASGHAMMGLSLAPATGKIVQSIIDSEKTQVNLNSFS